MYLIINCTQVTQF